MKFKGRTSSRWSLKWHKLGISSTNSTGLWLFRLYCACVFHIEESLTQIWVGFLEVRFEEGVNRRRDKPDKCFDCLFIILKLTNDAYAIVVGRGIKTQHLRQTFRKTNLIKAPS